MTIPETVYTRDGDGHHLAYQVSGDRGPDLLFVPTGTLPIDLLWDETTVGDHLRRLASFSRLILTDLLGMGSSDAVPINETPAMQSRADGLVAVLDAVGSESGSLSPTSCAPPTSRSGCPSRHSKDASTLSEVALGPAPSPTCWHPAGEATPQSAAGMRS